MTTVFGYCDGVKGEDLYGWAWMPDAPNDPVAIEVLIDGAFAFETRAETYRPDLRAAGIGHGRYGWRMPLSLNPDRTKPVDILVRAKGGEPLVDGSFTLDVEITPEDRADPAFQAFLATVTGRGPEHTRSASAAPPRTRFLLYCPVALSSDAMGANEYSYAFVMRAFAPVLAQLGETVPVADEDEANAAAAEALIAGHAAILFSFAPPHRTMLGLRCPTIPVIAWEFPTIPSTDWGGGERRHDWRFVLRQCGRAITLSSYAADAIRATMGADFPVIAAPSPVWDRMAPVHAAPPPTGAATVSVDGFALDTRGRSYSPVTGPPPLPAPGELPTEIALEGTVFTSVFSPRDGRKNWQDMVTAFATAFIDEPQATLVLKMVTPDPGVWWWELHDVLNRLRPFACRIVALQGFLPEDGYNDLIRASHWIACASHAEGQCLPLLEYMSGGRPAVSPSHTAMADYIRSTNALIVASDEENCGFPHDPTNELSTTRHRVLWSSLAAAFAEGHRIVRDDPERYAALAASARETMRDYCSDATVGAQIDGFLGLNLGRATLPPSPSEALRMAAAPL